MENTIRNAYPVAQFKALNEDQGIIEAIVSVFSNVDAGRDIVAFGAFTESLQRKLPKGVWAHDWKQPIAKTLEARELEPGNATLPPHLKDLGGLYIKAQFNLDTQRGREAFSDVKFGTIDEFSIGLVVEKSDSDNESGINTLTKCKLFEWSPVLVGMNDRTQLLSVKSHAGLTFKDELLTALAAIESVTKRAIQLNELREKEGRKLSAANRKRIQDTIDALSQCVEHLDALVQLDASEDDTEARSLYGHFLSLQISQIGV